ncbi:golgin-84-like [Hetaerina americana]|uniref:golgin-84-like n=1 Tax=Hetaerina americana TaxID=62018 RepID=UPI003A7F2714
MSWLSGLAGKAEDLLNKIDQNAAVALQKTTGPQYAVDDSVLMEVASQGDISLPQRALAMNNSVSRHAKSLTAPKPYPNLPVKCGPSILSESSAKLKSSSGDDELMRYLNSPKIEKKTPKKNGIFGISVSEGLPSTSHSQQNSPVITTPSKSKRNIDVEVESAMRPAQDGDSIEVAVGSGAIDGFGSVLSPEEEDVAAVRDELRAREQEVLVARRKLGETQQEVDLLRNRLASMELHMSEVKDMYSQAIEDSKKIAEAAIAGRFQAQSELDRVKNEFSYSMDDKTHALELLKSKMEGELVAANNKTSSLQRRYDALLEEIRNERLEQERYRARAQAVLAGRDREIAELRAGVAPREQCVDSEAVECEREKERQTWEEEVQKLREEVSRLRGLNAEARRQWEGDHERMEDDLLTERGRREAAEEQERVTLQELRSARAELERMRQGELELRQKLSKEEERKVGSRRGEWEGSGRSVMVRDVVDDSVSERLAALTSTLVEKQVRVESLTAERNALRLQLEKTDHLYRDAVAHLGQGSSGSLPGQNDTDDVKARIPSFLLESPFDTAVARKVKRAYSSLDSVGVRVGIFLRRYPLARTLLLSYTVLLHLWVVIVLLTYTPDVH